jgi:hypothetical protein
VRTQSGRSVVDLAAYGRNVGFIPFRSSTPLMSSGPNTGSGEEREGVETKHARRSNTSTKPREPDLLLLVESTEEPQQRWPDRNSRLSYGGKSLAQIV